MFGWLDPLKGNGYQFWSGIGSGSPILAAAIVWWHHHRLPCPPLLAPLPGTRIPITGIRCADTTTLDGKTI